MWTGTVGLVGSCMAVLMLPSAPVASAAPEVSGWPTSRASVVVGDALTNRVRLPRGTQELRVQRRGAGERWVTEQSLQVGSRRAQVSIAGTEQGTWRYRLKARTRTRTLTTSARRVTVVDPGPDWSATHHAVGDIGHCKGDPGSTAALLPDSASLLALGDIAYPKGRVKDFRRCYLPHYGRLLDTTWPVPGNHEYFSGGDGYFATFGSRAGTARKSWYALDSGPWRILMLNSNCSEIGGCRRGSKQYRWVTRQLRDHPRRCLAAAWHAPVHASGSRGSDRAMKPLQRRLTRTGGADVVLNGHNHHYERFARIAAGGRPDPRGARLFIVGSGGAPLYEFVDVQPGSQVRYNGGLGVLRLDLAADSYRWEFVAVGGGDVDSGVGTCG